METTLDGGASLQASGVETPLIETFDIHKTFGAVRALKGVSLSFRRGEVHGLVGANGAGKSTFLDIVGGVVLPSSGTICVDGQEISIQSPRDAESLGFAFIHQELPLVPDFSAVENMTLAMRSRLGITNRREHLKVAREAADRIGATFSLRKAVRELSAAERGLVAIAQALVVDARFIAMDEPTAALSETECERLFKIIRELAQSGVAIAYVSHRLDEIEELSQRVTVFKDGEVAGRFDRGSYGRRDLVLGITGSESLAPRLPPVAVDAEAPVTLQVEHLSNGVSVHDVSFKVRRGEILGLAGLVGSGRSETFTQILGASKTLSGQMILNGKPHRPTSVKRAVAAGVALVPEERRSQALVMSDTVKNNISLGNWKRMRVLRGFGLISDRKAGLVSDAMVKKLSIKASTTDVPVSTLSGGNQQKVVFGRWVARDSKLLLLDEPTRGVDIGARQHIWENVESLAVEGTAVVVASSELAELALCHRVVVIVEGKTVAEIQGPGVTEQEMLDAIYNYQMEEEA